jgi:hypothetical protein
MPHSTCLAALRAERDKTTGPIRRAYNAVCDRLEVLNSVIAQEAAGPAARTIETMGMQSTHIAKPELVTAIAISNCVMTATGYRLTLADNTDLEIPAATVEIFGGPQFGDYWVTRDGFSYIMKKTVFEHRYMKLASLPTDPRPLCYPMPPVEVCAAAELVGRYFATQNVGSWELGPCKTRFPRGALA